MLTRIQTIGMFFAPDGIRLEELTGGDLNYRPATTSCAAASVFTPWTVILPSRSVGYRVVTYPLFFLTIYSNNHEIGLNIAINIAFA